MSALDQWASYNNKLKNKVNEMFTSKKEGFSGILGANGDMDLVNTNERMDTQTNVGQLTQNIKTYQAAETNLQAKTNQYLNLNMNREPGVGAEKRNYNVFINKPAPVTQTVSGATVAKDGQVTNTGPQCISLTSLSTFVDSSDNGFDAAYPDNFTVFDKAKTACQTWAADLGFSFSGITKEQGQYRCYISQTPPESAPPYTKPGVLYTVAVNPNTTNGGLFSNGQIGVYRSNKNQKWDIQNMQKPLLLKHYNNPDYSTGPKPFKEAIDNNWWGWSKKPGPQGGEDLFPDDKTAWWVGFVENRNNIDKITWDGKTAGIGVSSGKCYFYYVYNSTGAVTAHSSVVSSCPGWNCPSEGQGARCPASAPGSFNVNRNCNNKKWTADRGAASGQIVGIYIVSASVLKINGISYEVIPGDGDGYGGYASVTLESGKNVFEIKKNIGIPTKSGFMLYVYDIITKKILFRSGDPGWGVTTSPAPDWTMVANVPPTAQTIGDPYSFKTVNNEPNGFSTCDKLVGGSINTKTINATYGKNCSTSTKKPLQVRYITISANTKGDPVQISQLVVMAFLNGVQGNVASRGTVTSSPGIDNLDNSIPLNGKTDNKEFWSSDKGQGAYWKLDLGTDFPLTSITYYNRDNFNWYADGMSIVVSNSAARAYNLKNPLKLTGQLVQTFNLAEEDIFYGSPNYNAAPPGFVRAAGQLGYGYFTLAEAKATCEAKGQRMCKKEEISLYDSCAASWNGFEETGLLGYPMAHGDTHCAPGDSVGSGQCGYCGGMRPGQAGFSPWVGWGGAPAGVYCCDKEHTGVYNPNTTPMV
jgi:hypothetical protein